MDNRFEIQLMKNHDETFFLRLRLKSRTSNVVGEIISNYDIQVGTEFSFKRLCPKVSIAAGALAEYQIENYSDQWEPTEIAQQSIECLQKLLELLKDKSRSEITEGYALNV